MSSVTRPSAIQCAELAARRAATDVRGSLERRVSSLATITVIAPLLGVFDAILGIANSFQRIGGSKSSGIAAVAYRLSTAMLPIIFGLFAAIMASWFYQALRAQLEIFDLEMKDAVVVAVEVAVAHLRKLRAADPILWARLVRSVNRKDAA
jgi:biopolymer transport protein ExbB/TolQ